MEAEQTGIGMQLRLRKADGALHQIQAGLRRPGSESGLEPPRPTGSALAGCGVPAGRVMKSRGGHLPAVTRGIRRWS
jgi:hypothetical protein